MSGTGWLSEVGLTSEVSIPVRSLRGIHIRLVWGFGRQSDRRARRCLAGDCGVHDGGPSLFILQESTETLNQRNSATV